MNLLKSLAAVSSMTMFSRVLGFARDAIVARVFGAGMATDAFFVAFKLPNLLRRIFAEGAFSQAFVPILAEYKSKQGEDATRVFVAYVSGLLTLALAIVTVPGVLVGGAITRWVSRLVPSVENYAAPEHAYRGQTGRLVEGAAMTGRRALVRWTDRHGTMHQLMAEPLREGDVIARGANVLILRDRERNPRLIEI